MTKRCFIFPHRLNYSYRQSMVIKELATLKFCRNICFGVPLAQKWSFTKCVCVYLDAGLEREILNGFKSNSQYTLTRPIDAL